MEIMPYVRFAMHHVWLENYYIERSIWDHEIIFIEHGSLKFIIDGKTYIAKENDCVLLRPRIPHIIQWNNENCSQPHVHFDFCRQGDSDKVPVSFLTYEKMNDAQKLLFREDFYQANGINMPYIIHLKNPLKIKNFLFTIIDEFTYKKQYSDIILQGLMTQLIGTILRENLLIYTPQDHKNQQLNDIIVYMNENVDNNLSLDDFADKFKISKWSLIELFKHSYHCSPIKYYNQLKYLRAKDLLQYSFLTINEIAEKMNYNEPQTFSRWFKSIDGSYPKKYRNK